MSTKTCDAVIIGGGIMGVSTAFQLARRGLKQVAILEKGPHVASGSTGQSSAVVRLRYANLEVTRLAHWSLQMFQQWTERLELVENRSGFSPVGVVWIPGDEDDDPSRVLANFAEIGAAGEMAPTAELQRRYPALNLCRHPIDLAGKTHDCGAPAALFWEAESGYADPQGTTEDLLRAGQALGVELHARHEVTSIVSSKGGTFEVSCADGQRFSAGRLLNAAGPWCNRVNALLDVQLPMNMQPTRVQMAVRNRPQDVSGDIPVFISAGDQVYGRPEARGSQLLIGSVAAEDESERVEDPDDFDTNGSPEFRERMMHKLHHRFVMQSRGRVHGYAALYTVNTDDWHPIVDAVGPEGYFVANGFSGHGFKLGPSMGAMIARRMTDQALPDDPEVDVGYFAADRSPIHSSGGVLA
ncbi:MAG: FAD-binding oxidoreductase [Planctomycetota bacterium]|nr:MAG: FAD-binding oxidoreductase [Planctomycetota bacterium]REJ94515.1 MAG: FAD-binding oxidoreductase [Planctomycetota bacterium]REK18623.1 MAG: FAD-binding oxidoreductase [Planctomycetota bacterium]REK37519.1 MAG: FAD-binding oxidoreductase [Planctomycetota bacterium]